MTMETDFKKLSGEELLLLRVLRAEHATAMVNEELDRRAVEGKKPLVQPNIASKQHGSRAA